MIAPSEMVGTGGWFELGSTLGERVDMGGERRSPSVRLPVAVPGSLTTPGATVLSDWRFDHLLRRHPCLAEEAHGKYGRVHLPVSPACNIQCRFCSRGFHKSAERPGVARSLLAPCDAVKRVERALELCPELSVVGVAGPGDSLATSNALDALRAVRERLPALMPCLSTNGLLLAERAQELWEAGVHAVTVTVNAVEPEILASIVSKIRWKGRTLVGVAGARVLAWAQAAGIRAFSALGGFVKVNMVVIPGVNDDHVAKVASACARWGAQRINLIPLLPQNEMARLRTPTCTELARARTEAERYLPVFRHCRQCRADACGIPGQGRDLGPELDHGKGGVVATFSHG